MTTQTEQAQLSYDEAVAAVIDLAAASEITQTLIDLCWNTLKNANSPRADRRFAGAVLDQLNSRGVQVL